jgi:hypothetical protein
MIFCGTEGLVILVVNKNEASNYAGVLDVFLQITLLHVLFTF